MAARTTATEVKQIIDTDLSDAIVDGYIATATAMVDQVYSSDTTTPSAIKEQVERWLTAHLMASTRVRQSSEEKAGPASVKYMGKAGMNLQSTTYGQNVLAIDTSGKFAALGGRRASIQAVASWND